MRIVVTIHIIIIIIIIIYVYNQLGMLLPIVSSPVLQINVPT
jgi:hypothetical protein